MKGGASAGRRLGTILLGTASGAALIGSAPFVPALADDQASDALFDHFTLNFGAEDAMYGGGHTVWANPYAGDNPRLNVRSGIDVNGSASLQSGDWILTLGAEYGRTGNSHGAFSYSKFTNPDKYSTKTGSASSHETHLMVDFTAGQDVGLGMFGLDGSSIVSGGVRYQHFVSRTVSSLTYSGKYDSPHYSTNFQRQIDRTFVAIGPTLSWNAKTPVLPDAGIGLTWGVDTALLVGERRYLLDGVATRSTSLALPEVGGYLGANWHFPDAPISLTVGYRADDEPGVVDAGFGTQNIHADRVSYGPFAQITGEIF